jgi:enterochelin esterase-like enzyme
MRVKYFLGIGIGILASIAALGSWYVFVAGAPQLDGPNDSAEAVVAEKLSYEVVSYPSPIFGGDRTYGVVLPPDYAKQPNQKYPVVFLLHGGHGDPTAWFKHGAALSVIQKVYADGHLPPSIIITPDGNDERGSSALWDPTYADGPNGKVLSAIGDELVQVIKSRYRTKTNPHFWAMGGLSSGGWGALNIGLHQLQNFSILFSHSGYFTDKSGTDNSPLAYVQKLSPQQRQNLSVYLDAGEGDGKYLDQSRQFHEVLDRLNVPNTFNAFPGGHGIVGADVGWNYWHKHLADSLTFVGQRFRLAEKAKK